jgi:hypothetical protein
MNDQTQSQRTKPILLFNDECGVCRRIGHWVKESAKSRSGRVSRAIARDELQADYSGATR